MARVRIMGLDPGLAHMGWGAIEFEGTRLTYVAHGVLTTKADTELPARLLCLHEALLEVLLRIPGVEIGVVLRRRRHPDREQAPRIRHTYFAAKLNEIASNSPLS